MKHYTSTLMRSAAALPIAIVLAAGAVTAMSTVNPKPAVAACNPCAAKNPCATKNPCAAKAACNPCNPCKAAGACNPCNPCSPCAASAGAASGCYVPRLKTASACNPCATKNPCAAKAACNPCNPCAAKAACNPCAAKNPCAAANPCAACNPSNPCAAAADVELSEAEAIALYACLKPVMKKAYKGGQHWAATKWTGFTNVSTQPYTSATHGGRKVINAVNKIGAKAYQKYEDVKKMPIGSTVAKPSFTIGKDGQAKLGPLFIMEKMTHGFNAATADWRYAAIMPTGATMGITKGINAGSVAFCHECHVSGEENDYMLFQPEEVRK